MTIDEIKALDAAGVESRAAEIAEAMKAEGADLEALNAEVTALEERKAVLAEEQRKAAEAVKNGAGKTLGKPQEKKTMKTIDEIRASQEYINAYAEYLKTGDDTEVRSVLTEGGTSSATTAGVPVPTYVEARIRTAWDNDEIMSRVRRTAVKGNLKVGFELSATDAGIHTEGAISGTGSVAEEVLNLGIVNLVPQTIKKWITFSDEVMDMKGSDFLDYIYDEIEHKIVKKAADMIIADITGAPTTATTSAASVVKIATAGIADFVNATSQLSDEATNPVIIMNKASYAYYKGLAMAAGYAVDPFDGMTVLFNNTLAVATVATTGTHNIAIVGDLDGVQANFPNGYQPTFKYDDLSLAESDLVKVVGRLPMAHGVTACGRFCVLTKTVS